MSAKTVSPSSVVSEKGSEHRGRHSRESALPNFKLRSYLPSQRFFLLSASSLSCFALVAILILFSCGSLRAQSTNATLNGQVTDTSGAVVPNAKVVVVNDATGVRYETKTNNDGIYVEPNLPPGMYHIEITKDGFKTLMQPGIELHVQDGRAANYTLQVGAASETVTVHEQSYMINTQDATVSTTIDRTFAENIPLNGRSFQTLILLTPGSVLTRSGSGATDNGGQFTINGQRANANAFTVDGVSADVGSFLTQSNPGQLNGANPGFTVAGTTQGMVAVDALEEFKIQTSSYAPEFGRQPGGQVSLLTRSGTNLVHGTASDYFRNTVLDANTWFNDLRGLPKGVERQNDFGGTLGGPILKDKTFFFFSYEGLRLLQPANSFITTVPALCLRGSGPCLSGESPAAPAYQAILNSWPLPQGPERIDSKGNPTGGAPYTINGSFPTNLDSYGVRIDHSLGKRLNLFGRYSDTSSLFTVLGAFPDSITNKLRSQSTTVGTNGHLRPNLEDELRVNYGVNKSTVTYNQSSLGGAKPFDISVLNPAPLSPQQDNSEFVLFLPASTLVTNPGPLGKFAQRQINVVNSLSQAIGTHQMKWGVDYRRLFPIFSKGPLAAFYEIFSNADLNAGNVTIAGLQANVIAHPIYTNLSLYGQDAWRMSRRLTLTYGLRWELNPAPGERDGIQPFNVIGISNPSTATLAPIGSSLYKTTYNNFAPRLGLAYQLRQSLAHETVVRGGFGVFYDLNSETAAIGFANQPFTTLSPFLRSVPFPIPANTFQVPALPASVNPPYNKLYGVDPNLQLPYTLQWNFSMEQALGENQALTASYVASAADRLLRSDNLFDFGPLVSGSPTFRQVQAVRNASSSNYQSLQLQFSRRVSRGLQALAGYTYSHSIDNASDGQIAQSAALTGSSFLDPNIDRGNSSFDLRHAFRGALTYNVPAWNANHLTKAVVGGWSVDTIGLAQTGLPVDLSAGLYRESNLPQGSFQLRPNLVPGIPLYLYGAQCSATNGGVPCPGGRAFNFTPGAVAGGCVVGPGIPNAPSTGPFCPVPKDANGNPTQIQGTLGRNVMRDFGAWQMDFALHKQFNLTERVHLQFRSEFFNVFNHPNFSGIDPNVRDVGTFGLSRGTLANSLGGLSPLYRIGGSRSIQLALKLAF